VVRGKLVVGQRLPVRQQNSRWASGAVAVMRANGWRSS
jgi:hypothetical protein